MSGKSLRFILFLLIFLLIVFGLHLVVLNIMDKRLWEHRILLSYILNFAMAVLVLLLVERSLRSKSSHTGFLFMGGSAFKFLIFFLVFYPFYNKDGDMETAEFITFFVPYSLCLTLEVIYLSKELNNQDSRSEETP